MTSHPPKRAAVLAPLPASTRTTSPPTIMQQRPRSRSKYLGRPTSAAKQTLHRPINQTIDEISEFDSEVDMNETFSSSPVPFFDDYESLIHQHKRAAFYNAPVSPRLITSAAGSRPQSSFNNSANYSGFSRMPESIIMRFEDDSGLGELLDDGDLNNDPTDLPTLNQLMKKSKAKLKAKSRPHSSHQSTESSRQSSRQSSRPTTAHSDRQLRSAGGYSDHRKVRKSRKPSSLVALEAFSSGRQSAGSAIDEDEDDSDLDSEDMSDEDEEEDENSDADYVDSAIDDDINFMDPPTPTADSTLGGEDGQVRFTYPMSRPGTASATTHKRVTGEPFMSPPYEQPVLTLEELSAVIIRYFTPPSLFGITHTGVLTPVSNVLINQSVRDTVDTELPIMFPGFPVTSAAALLLQNEGLSLVHIQHLLSAMMIFSSAFPELINAIQSGLDFDGGADLQKKKRVIAMSWKLFVFALQGYVDGGKLDMKVAKVEQQRQEQILVMAEKREARIQALRDRDNHASDRLVHHQNIVEALRIQLNQHTEEQRELQALLDIEKRKQKDRNDTQKKRLAQYNEWQTRARVAIEHKRMLIEDRESIIRHAPVLEANCRELLAEVQRRREENARFSNMLDDLIQEVKDYEATRDDAYERDKQADLDIETSVSREEEAAYRTEQSTVEKDNISKIWLPAVRDRVRVMQILMRWIEEVGKAEAHATSLCRQVENFEEKRELIIEEMEGMKLTEADLEAELVVETTTRKQLEGSLESHDTQVKHEREMLKFLVDELSVTMHKHAEITAKRDSLVAVLKDHERRSREGADRVSLTTQAIESMNAQSVAIDRYNYAKIQEMKALDETKERLEQTRSELRQAVDDFEANKAARIAELEARNQAKEKECVAMMQRVLAEEKKIDALGSSEAELERALSLARTDREHVLHQIEQAKASRVALLEQIERAKQETVAMKDNVVKVQAIQAAELASLEQLKVAHANQMEAFKIEIAAIEQECEGVHAEVLVVKQQLYALAVQRQELDKAHQEDMTKKQEALAVIVRAGQKQDEEMKAFMINEKSKREAVQAEIDSWQHQTLLLKAEQQSLSLKILRAQRKREAEEARTATLKVELVQHEESNQHHMRKLQDLAITLNQSVNDYYIRARDQQPALQTLAYVRACNKDLRQTLLNYEARQRQRLAQCNVQDAAVQTEPLKQMLAH